MGGGEGRGGEGVVCAQGQNVRGREGCEWRGGKGRGVMWGVCTNIQ